MKKPSSFIFLIALSLLVVISLFVAYGRAEDNRWKFFGDTDDGSLAYDTKSISYLPHNRIRVWTKLIYSKESKFRQEMIGLHGEKYKDLAYTLDFWELDCSQNTLKVFESIYSKPNGEKIQSYNFYSLNEERPILPGSILEILKGILCEKNKNKK